MPGGNPSRVPTSYKETTALTQGSWHSSAESWLAAPLAVADSSCTLEPERKSSVAGFEQTQSINQSIKQTNKQTKTANKQDANKRTNPHTSLSSLVSVEERGADGFASRCEGGCHDCLPRSSWWQSSESWRR
jgi:hypothetical protein